MMVMIQLFVLLIYYFDSFKIISQNTLIISSLTSTSIVSLKYKIIAIVLCKIRNVRENKYI